MNLKHQRPAVVTLLAVAAAAGLIALYLLTLPQAETRRHTGVAVDPVANPNGDEAAQAAAERYANNNEKNFNKADKRGRASDTLTDAATPSKGGGAGDSPSKNGPTFENGVLTTPDVKIQITRYKIIAPGQKGNEYDKKPVIAFWYKTTNLSGAKVDPDVAFIGNFTAYQDNNPNAENELDVGSLPDDRFLHSQTENIKKGGTVENAMAYELDDLVTPVDLVAKRGLDEIIGKATYKLR
jgi:hypothetical protein